MLSIDLNCDMGEAFGNYNMPNDEKLMPYISSVNVACGFHAGDASVMQKTVQLAKKHHISIGAHPGLPDLQGFGRREMKITPAEAYQITLYQIGALAAFVKAEQALLHHVKPHGALYNMAAKDVALAAAIAQAVADFNPQLIFYGLSGSEMIKAAKSLGLKTAAEVFADRTYQDDGHLSPRGQSNALITNHQDAIKQVLDMVKHKTVNSVTGKKVAITADTICIHGDGVHAVSFAQQISNTLKTENISICSPQ